MSQSKKKKNKTTVHAQTDAWTEEAQSSWYVWGLVIQKVSLIASIRGTLGDKPHSKGNRRGEALYLVLAVTGGSRMTKPKL